MYKNGIDFSTKLTTRKYLGKSLFLYPNTLKSLACVRSLNFKILKRVNEIQLLFNEVPFSGMK